MAKALSVSILLLLSSICLQAQDLSKLFTSVNNSVVVIETTEEIPLGGGSRRNTASAQGIGTGVLISADGKIMTAAHVVQTAESVKVHFQNGEVIPAEVIASAPAADVALIKINWMPKDPVIAKVGDSDLVSTGDRICIIGTPLGLEQSLSVGYISGRRDPNKTTRGFYQIEYFQTDAAINHGNSGGPMFNMKGEVIGIVSYILSESGGFEGLGFAATSNMATKLLLEEQSVWWGTEMQILQGATAKMLNVPQEYGLLVQKVVPISPAGVLDLRGGSIKANIEGTDLLLGGDIIIAINGIRFSNKNSLLEAEKTLRGLKKGDEVSVEILREGKIQTLQGELP
ncbi:trypsin-like peptidase domain-containing protein [Flammeovirgaceae bacterium SG7u.111]|nr:trypsin-like peptidase domain-containing protein [Flammeovirgaceae bacterium SG7u.132]WPO33091.1 trypsin-like peptidase domain-containing protein [Flammeovirgaceae bacterium SG7u.111]